MPSLFSSKDKTSVMNALKVNEWSGEWTSNRKGIAIRLTATHLNEKKTVDYSFTIKNTKFDGVANSVTESLSVIERCARKGPADINEVFLTKTEIEQSAAEPEKPKAVKKTAKPKASSKPALVSSEQEIQSGNDDSKPVKKATKKTAKKAAKAKPEPSGNSKFSPDAKITVLAEKNPKREGGEAHKRFELYRNGMTVAKALEAGVLRMDLSWDTRHSFISIA